MYFHILINDNLEVELRFSQDLEKLSIDELQEAKKLLEEYYAKLGLELELEETPAEFEQHVTEEDLRNQIETNIQNFNEVQR